MPRYVSLQFNRGTLSNVILVLWLQFSFCGNMERSGEDAAAAGNDQRQRKRKRSLTARAAEDAELRAATCACPYCGKEFKTRGLKIHEKHCKSKKAKAQEKARVYKWSIINDNAFAHILGFLSNQSLTKLQGVTGDRYPQCQSHLSRYCCACENDNPVIVNGLCGVCESTLAAYRPLITKTEAKTWYGIRDFANIPCDVRRRYTLYARIDLEKHMLEMFGSRLEWVKSIALKKTRTQKRAAVKRQKHDEAEAFLQTLPVAFGVYARQLGLKPTNKADLEVYSARFLTLTAALEARHLSLRTDSQLCKKFIAFGAGLVENVVDTMEEMAFLFGHTAYANRCKQKIAAISEEDREFRIWYPREEYEEMKQDCRDDAKMELCVEYLEGDNSLTLPHKWERCRERFDRVKAAGMEPHHNGVEKYVYMDQLSGKLRRRLANRA
ncbi:hypothetical protein BBJ28_00009129 [Nothophytophthora sp. Chile5]|nr:hypothetical protein BBJ28_00009129 [Nothophytophthora sp. Chile5]